MSLPVIHSMHHNIVRTKVHKSYHYGHKLHHGVITIGNFDGVHIGHQHIIHHVLKTAQMLHTHSVLFTFDPHPLEVLKTKKNFKYLCTLSQKIKLLQHTNLNHIIVKVFNKSFAKISPIDFIKNHIVQPLKPAVIIVGSNFRFGNKGAGNIQLLKKLGDKYHFKVKTVAKVKQKGFVVSSSCVRKLVTSGKWHKVRAMLGRAFVIKAQVVKGEGRGKKLGIPTINCQPEKNQLIPSQGVYVAQIKEGRKTLPAAVNIGVCPTFKKAHHLTTASAKKNQIEKQITKQIKIEVHLIGIKKLWSKQTCEIEIIKYLRKEKTFATPQQLVTQIKKDIRKAEQYF